MCRLRFRSIALALLVAVLPTAGGCAQRAASGQTPEFWAFTGPWDVESATSLRDHGGRLAAVVTGWITLDSLTGLPLLPSQYADTLRPRAGTPKRMAIVTSWHGERFHAASIRSLARAAPQLARASGSVARYAAQMGYDGLVFDFETLEPADVAAQVTVLKAMSDSARAAGVRTIAVAIPATDTLAYPARRLLEVADYLIVMLYDQHWLGSNPGPISAPDWFEGALRLRVEEAGASRLIAGLPAYGYHWQRGQPTRPVTYREAEALAASLRVPLRRDTATHTLRAATPAGGEVWVTDAELLTRLVQAGQALGVHRFALWRLGQEDPAIWGRVVP